MILRKRYQLLTILLCFCIPLIISSCKNDDDTPVTATNTITDQVVISANFSLLETAVLKANLQATLSSAGPFTVFAPDNAAFAASGLTEAKINSLTSMEVKNILLYHTISAKIMAADVPAGPNEKVITEGGDSVFVTKNTNGVFINGVRVNTADVSADNGVIHIIGRVLMPPAGNIVETAVAAGLDSLVKAVTIATTAPGGDPSLAGTLGSAKLTVFAPTNAAFSQLLTLLSLSKIEDIPVATLLAVLRYHVVGDRAFSSDLTNGNITMLASGSTMVNLTNGSSGGPTITGNGNNSIKSNITATDIVCRNGVVHLIDRVLLP